MEGKELGEGRLWHFQGEQNDGEKLRLGCEVNVLD